MSDHKEDMAGADQAKAYGSSRQEVKREVVEFVKMVAWFLVLFFLLRTYVIEGYEVQGPSMQPSLYNGERILVFKLWHELSKLGPFRGLSAIQAGDIVVFDSTDEADKRYVKRVVAEGPAKTAGNVVGAAQVQGTASPAPAVKVEVYEVKDEAGESYFKVYADNKCVDQQYLPHAEQWQRLEEQRRRPDCLEYLSPGQYFVMGDNRRVSRDSRSFGPVSDDHIIGKAVLRFWPPHRISFLR